jgi:GxxExxY protein
MSLQYQELTGEIINSFYQVYNELGFGFLERVYQNALVFELKDKGFQIEVNKKIKVYYKGFEVGFYIADILVNEVVVLELKACDYLVEEFEYQLLNYLKATDCEVGLLLNFGKKPEFKRKLFHNHFKTHREH